MSPEENVIRISAASGQTVPDVRASGESRSSAHQAQTPFSSSESDAVKVTFSSEVSARLAKEAGNDSVKLADEEAKSNKQSAEETAQSFEDLINAISPTQVRFGVSVASKGEAINFQVVDKKSGKVVREFPPESLHRTKNLVEANGAARLFLNHTV